MVIVYLLALAAVWAVALLADVPDRCRRYLHGAQTPRPPLRERVKWRVRGLRLWLRSHFNRR